MTAPNYEENIQNEATLHGDLYIPLLADKYTAAKGANNPDFVALSDTIGILEGARNSVLPVGSSPFYQPYQIDASIKFDWSTDVATYMAAPYGYNSTTQPYAPFYLTEYKFDGAALTPISGDRTKPLDCTINKGVRSTSPCSLPRKTEGNSSTSCPSNCI